MPRYFINIELTSPELIDADASDLHVIVAIREGEAGFEIEKTVFDFTIGIVGPRTANNRIHTHRLHKARIEGFLQNVLQLGKQSREVSEDEYQRIRDRLFAKSAHMQQRRRRKLVVTEVVDPIQSRLP